MYGAKQKTEEEGYVADNGWFDGETLSAEEENREALRLSCEEWKRFKDRFVKHCYQEETQYSEMVKAVQSFHMKGDWGFLGKIEKADIFVPQKGVMRSYASNKRAFAAAEKHNLSTEELTGLLWRRYRLGAERSRLMKNGEHSSLIEQFPIFYSREKNAVGADRDERIVKAIYLQMLASSIGGAVKEFQTYHYLKNIYGDLVEWGDEEDDAKDVDLFFAGYPISVKSSGGFTFKSFDFYRKTKGYREPEAYVQPQLKSGKVSRLEIYVPIGDHGSYQKVDESIFKKFARSPKVSSETTTTDEVHTADILKSHTTDKKVIDTVASELSDLLDDLNLNDLSFLDD